MNTQLLIDSIVRQVTVLIAQLATSGGVRAPIAHIANQVFVELARELEAQGVSRKVGADMFGMALRGYLRKLQRLTEGQTDSGRTLWRAVLDHIVSRPLVTRADILERFKRDDQLQVSAVLRDLKESGLVFSSGRGDPREFSGAYFVDLQARQVSWAQCVDDDRNRIFLRSTGQWPLADADRDDLLAAYGKLQVGVRDACTGPGGSFLDVTTAESNRYIYGDDSYKPCDVGRVGRVPISGLGPFYSTLAPLVYDRPRGLPREGSSTP